MNVKGELRYNEILAPHTSWHIGGKADRYFSPFDLSELKLFLSELPMNEPLTWLGLGSNVLIADAGIRGTVIHTLGMKSEIQPISETLVRAEMGIPCAKLAKFCAKHSLRGGEFFAGIPGTVGGALFMNAGAFGGETWPKVVQVDVINHRGEIITRPPEHYHLAYRSVKLKEEYVDPTTPQEWFVAGIFQFEQGVSEEAVQATKALLKKRNETQPIGVFSCGSVFVNPKNAYVGQLIEQAGLKGLKIGGAEISTKHANFIINTGTATAEDVLALMKKIVETVYDKFNILLESEVRLLGFEQSEGWYPEHLRASTPGAVHAHNPSVT